MTERQDNPLDEVVDRFRELLDEAVRQIVEARDNNPPEGDVPDEAESVDEEVQALEAAVKEDDAKGPDQPHEPPEMPKGGFTVEDVREATDPSFTKDGEPGPVLDGDRAASDRSPLDDYIDRLPHRPSGRPIEDFLDRRPAYRGQVQPDAVYEPQTANNQQRAFDDGATAAQPSSAAGGTARVEHIIRVEVSPNADLVSEINAEMLPAVINLIASMKAELQDEWQTQIEIIQGGGTIQ